MLVFVAPAASVAADHAPDRAGAAPARRHAKTPARSRPRYPTHRQITATVFWVGEPKGGGSSENNAFSAFDDSWLSHFGGVDDPYHRHGYAPAAFTPRENPFYLDLPYTDISDSGEPKHGRTRVIPWARDRPDPGPSISLMKNRWVELRKDARTCYGQIEDAGPYVYDDKHYVFGPGAARPRSHRAKSAGMDVSPALRDRLHFREANGQDDRVDWRFAERTAVPGGPWRQLVTTRQRYCAGGC